MKNSNMVASRMFSIFTVVALVFALSVTGALAGFWRTLSDGSTTGVPNPMDYLWGFGQGDNGAYGYGYGYGWGYDGQGLNNDWFGYGKLVTETDGGNSGGGGSSGGGWSHGGGWSTGGGNTGGGNTGGDGSCVFPNYATSFTDVSGNWAESYINDLASKGIMNGVNSTLGNPTGAFEPDRSTTRIEMLKIALRTFCYEYKDLAGNENFGDVANGSWQARVVERANQLGIIDASNANFRPNDAVSRAEAIKMLLNVGETRTAALTVDSSVTSTVFTDVTTDWQAKYFETARKLGIINGQMVDGNLVARPADAVTRSENSKVAQRSQALWTGWSQSAAQ